MLGELLIEINPKEVPPRLRAEREQGLREPPRDPEGHPETGTTRTRTRSVK